jgi:hypothetical protein
MEEQQRIKRQSWEEARVRRFALCRPPLHCQERRGAA